MPETLSNLPTLRLLIAKGQPEDVYVLTLDAENTLTLNGEAIDF